jgi:ABC-2 type transport system permease protein
LDQLDAELTNIERTIAQVQSIPAWVLSAPFEAELKNVVPKEPTYIAFYAPAVLALLLQHLAITLGALSMARIRLLGLMELLQTSPVRPAEAVVGNYLSYGVLCAVAGGALLGLIVLLLGVPVFGSYAALGGMMALLVLCALGIGFIISMISSSEQQAAQLAMLILIATVFFSGFVVPVDTLVWPVRAISYALPATYAIRTFQDVMLRGVLRTPEDLVILAAAAVLLFLVTVALFRREYRPR